jgi:hypothetical protein
MSHGKSSRSGSSKQPSHQGPGGHGDEGLPSRPFSLPPGYFDYYGIPRPKPAEGAVQAKRPGLNQGPHIPRGVLEYYGIVPHAVSDSSPSPVQQKEEPQAKPAPEVLPAIAAAVPTSAEPMAVQAKTDGSASKNEMEIIHEAAARGTSGPGGSLPYRDQIQKSFGKHNVSQVQAHTGHVATEAARAMGAEAYTTGEHVAFAGAPSLHTAAHEAAHVIQQRTGVHLKGGVGEVGDPYERHADAVADAVVQGKSSEALLDDYAGTARPPSDAHRGSSHELQQISNRMEGSPPAGAAGTSVQRREAGGAQTSVRDQRGAAELLEEAIRVIETALAVATSGIEESSSAPRAAAGDADADPGGSGPVRAARTATPRVSPEIVGHLQAGLGGLLALRGAPEEEIRRAVTPILTHIGAPGLGGNAGGAGDAAARPVQRNTLVLGAPLLAGGPPGWVAYAVLGVATVGIMGYAAYQTYHARAEEGERAVPRVMPRTARPTQHRGRLQVQGGGLELSVAWARPVPMTKAEGLAGLAELRAMLTRTQLSERDEAFVDAAAFITATLHTCPPDIRRKFQNRAVRQRRGDERVDIEIHTGIAFA